jgi:hypothetical protein
MVSGDVRVRNVGGWVTLEHVGGDLRADRVLQGLEAHWVGADARIGAAFPPGASYRVRSGGNLRVYIPPGAGLCLSLVAGGDVHSNVQGLVLDQSEGEFTGLLGAGGAELRAEAGGHIRLRAAAPLDGPGDATDVGSLLGPELSADLAGLRAELGAQLEEQISSVMADMSAHLDEAMSRIDSEGIRDRVLEAVEQGRRSALRAVDRERKLAEQSAERARMRAERAERRWRRVDGRRQQQRQARATDEERLRVLRMVEDGRLDPGEAADLLAALDGR